jgi:addiction module RelE/StbE family toxin
LKLRYTPDAIADLRKVLAYIETQSPHGAHKVQARIQRLITLTLDHPHLGTRSRRLRRLVARPCPYLIFYEVGDDEIVIHGVRHSARRP